VIFDFIDERFDLLAAGDAIATASSELHRSGYLKRRELKAARPLPRLSAASERLWLEAAGEFAALVRATPLGQAQLILHAARWATDQRLADGTVVPVRDVEIVTGQGVEIAPYNDLLARQEAAFLGLMPKMARIDAAAQRLADPQHRWGLSPFHYVPEYYDEVRRQLAAVGLAEAFSDPSVAPSVPVA